MLLITVLISKDNIMCESPGSNKYQTMQWMSALWTIGFIRPFSAPIYFYSGSGVTGVCSCVHPTKDLTSRTHPGGESSALR